MHVNDWEDIGISDPFPNEDTFTKSTWDYPENATTYIYSDKKLIKEYIPNCCYIPNKQMMFKLMRACLGVRTVD